MLEAKDKLTTEQKNFGWRFGNGPEFPGAAGKLAADPATKYNERPALKLDADFSKGGGYVEMVRTVSEIDVGELSLWLKDPDYDVITLRLGDDSGQMHQFRLQKPKSPEWQELRFDVAGFFAKKESPEVLEHRFYGGANDGRWYGPATFVSVVARKAEGTHRTLWLGDAGITPAPETPKSIIEIDPLVEQSAWTFSTSHTMPGVRGGLAIDAPTKSLKLSADFTDGGGYVLAERDINRELLAIKFKYKTDNVTLITVRLTDGSGQTHQRTRQKLIADGQWHEMVIKPYKIAGGERWGGANDGKWHGPVASMAIAVPYYAKPDSINYDLHLSDLRGETLPGREAQTPAPPKPDLSAPLAVTPLPLERRLTSRPAYGFNIKYRWQAAPLDKDYTAFVHFVDAEGRTVLSDDHLPPTPTSKWSGDVSYERTVFLPAHTPRSGRTVPGMTAGEYRVYVGLHEQEGRRLLAADSPIKPDDQRRYQIGTLVIDDNAPLPELPPKTLDLTGYKITFQDEFDGPLSVSAWGPAGEGGTKWIAHTPFRGDFGDARFADPTPEFPFTTKDGILRIEVRKETPRWRGGLLSSADPQGNGFSQKYGYFEMRAKLPKGPGTWPALWMGAKRRLTEADDRSLTHIEIDVLEQYGHWPNKLCTAIHQWPRSGKGAVHEGKNYLVSGMTEDFHTYGAMVTPEHIIFYFDGRELRREKTPPSGHDSLYVMVNLTLGPGWPLDKTPSPSYLYVDYVRVYAKQ